MTTHSSSSVSRRSLSLLVQAREAKLSELSSQAAMQEAMLIRRDNDLRVREQGVEEMRAELAEKLSQLRKREHEQATEHSVRAVARHASAIARVCGRG